MKTRRTFLVAAAAVLAAQAAYAGVDVNINVGVPAVPVPVAPVAPAPPPVVIEEPPQFIAPSPLGFYVAVGVPYDLFFVSNRYYLYRNNVWYAAPSYAGPWRGVRYGALPPGLRRHRIDRIRAIREDEYRAWRGDRDHYRGRWFRPEKERRKEEHERRKEEHERWKEERGHGHGRGHGRGHDDD